MTSPVLFSSPISHWFVFLIRPRTFQDECLHHREVYVRLLRRNKTDYINEFKRKKKQKHSGMFLARMQSVCVWTGGCVCTSVCVCLYDEQSQICMDTVIGILSVFSCSLKRDDWPTVCPPTLTETLFVLCCFYVFTWLCSRDSRLTSLPSANYYWLSVKIHYLFKGQILLCMITLLICIPMMNS